MNDKKALTYEDIANIFDKNMTGRGARTFPISAIVAWAEKRTDLFEFKNGRFFLAEKRIITYGMDISDSVERKR